MIILRKCKNISIKVLNLQKTSKSIRTLCLNGYDSLCWNPTIKHGCFTKNAASISLKLNTAKRSIIAKYVQSSKGLTLPYISYRQFVESSIFNRKSATILTNFVYGYTLTACATLPIERMSKRIPLPNPSIRKNVLASDYPHI
jgi:hypothetical protein